MILNQWITIGDTVKPSKGGRYYSKDVWEALYDKVKFEPCRFFVYKFTQTGAPELLLNDIIAEVEDVRINETVDVKIRLMETPESKIYKALLETNLFNYLVPYGFGKVDENNNVWDYNPLCLMSNDEGAFESSTPIKL